MNVSILLFICLLTAVPALSANTLTNKVDPTRPFTHKGVITGTPAVKKMVLESIIYRDNTDDKIAGGLSSVVINAKVLKLFDYIGEYQLIIINKQSVVLRSKSERVELSVFKNNLVKVKAAK